MILHVANLGNPVLRSPAKSVDPKRIQDPLFQAFLDDLLESMHFHDGVGLAAPQVFRSERVVAVWVPDEMDDDGPGLEPAVYINPELTPVGQAQVVGWEGCLSLKDLRGRVPRFESVRLRALDRNGKPIKRELSGFSARVFQHELDHLDGIVFVDRMEDMSSLVFLAELERFGSPQEDEDGDAQS
jgi:peptide deformylase